MNDLKEKVNEEIKLAMKAKDKTRLNVFRYLKKLFIENDTSGGKPKTELDILIAYAKKVKDSKSMYPAGSDQYKEIEAELKVMEEYLPKALTESEVNVIINEIVKKLDAPNMGMVMKELSPQIKGRFDGKQATNLVIKAIKN